MAGRLGQPLWAADEVGDVVGRRGRCEAGWRGAAEVGPAGRPTARRLAGKTSAGVATGRQGRRRVVFLAGRAGENASAEDGRGG